ncbi:S-layer homology domain-containing protein [Bacillus sp. 3255]|uniref:S-layer homology domain-containing protein n=1 Tax=Bacillus sp. 3255 TaxID=2817904 RepID=UPI0028612AE0|nr:S-layer homology domain-containing protein [Bacillus sp. 3255]MDR6881336.1 hypothetical protein [Bacillus sp. 3255]
MIQKKKLIGMAGIIAACGLLLGSSVQAETGKYQDVPDGYPYQSYIEELSAKKLVDGTGDGQFSPDSPLTREQFAKLVVMVFGLPAVDGGIPFEDCTEAWSRPYILSAYRSGIIQGTSEVSFSPKQDVSKQDAAVMLSRLFAADAVQQNEQDWAGGALTFIRSEVLPASLQSMLVDRQAPLSRGEAAALLSLTLQAREQGKSSAGASVTSSNGARGENAWILDPTMKEVTVHVQPGETLYVQAELKQHRTYELDVHGDHQSVFDMELSNADGTVLNQGYVSTMQVTPGSDGLIHGKIRTDGQKGAITLRLLEVGLDLEHPINLKAGRSEQLSPKGESLYYKAVANPDNPLMVLAKGAVSYQLVQVSTEWVPPKKGVIYPDGYGYQVKDIPGHELTNIDYSTSALHGEAYTLNCECVVRLSAPANTTVSLTVMDGSSMDKAYAIGWDRSEWKTGYKGNSIAGIFYQLELEEGRDYTLVTNEQLKEQPYDEAKERFKKLLESQSKSTDTSSEPDIPAIAVRKLTLFGPDGTEVLVDEKLTGAIPFKAAKTGTYVVKLQSDVQNHTTEIKVNKAD